MKRKPKHEYSIQSVSRALSLLEQFVGAEDELRLKEMSLRLDTNKNYLLRLLATLESRGYVEKNAGTLGYRLGGKVLTVGHASIDARHLSRASLLPLKELASITGETVFSVLLRGESLTCASMVASTLPVRVVALPEEPIPLHCSAAGKLLLAFNPRTAARYLEGGLKPYTERTITSPASLLRHLQEIRSVGYAVEMEEYEPGLCGVAAPIRDFSSRVCAAVSVVAPTFRFASGRITAELAPLVLQAASAISGHLGYQPPCQLQQAMSIRRIGAAIALEAG
jgi:IclR family transcriptional regulator, KDG regulon repressor